MIEILSPDLGRKSGMPEWVHWCFETPRAGIIEFLKNLCEISGAQYAHIRLLSRGKKFYTMVESIGPYKGIGKHRRFHLLDERKPKELAYDIVDYRVALDCKQLEEKHSRDSNAHAFLRSLLFGLWIPLEFHQIELGYVTLSWSAGKPDSRTVSTVRGYMQSIIEFLPLLFNAGRSVIADEYLNKLWASSGIILSSASEPLCYDSIATACGRLWGEQSTTYIAKVNSATQSVEIVTVKGFREKEAGGLRSQTDFPLSTGLMGYTVTVGKTVISDHLATDSRFTYHSLLSSGDCLGSAISTLLVRQPTEPPIAVISVEHELENYFDTDDMRYIGGVARIGHDAICAHRGASDRLRREIDTLFTQMSHDIAEPMQALVSDADVLKYQASLLEGKIEAGLFEEMLSRAATILDNGLSIHKLARKNLDEGIDGASTRVIEGRINLFRLLNSLVDTWDERAANQGVEIKPLFDSLRGIHVRCDETELKLVLGDLIANAIKYSFFGRRHPQGSTTKYERYVSIVGRLKVGQAIIEFQNYGVGILPSEFQSVKEKFYRGELAKREGRAGTGRGLWRADTFFKSIGGGIEIWSEDKRSDASQDSGPFLTTIQAIMPYDHSDEV